MKHKSSAQFMSKLNSYQGLFVFLPYIAIKMLKLANNPLSDDDIYHVVIFFLILLGVMIVGDIIGVNWNVLDKYNRVISSIVAVLTSILLYYIYTNSRGVWDNTNSILLISVSLVITLYTIIGWFFIRSDKTNKPSKEDKPLRSSAHCFLGAGISWSMGYFFGDFGLYISLIFWLLLYPIVVYIGDRRFIEKDENIINTYKLAKREDLVGVVDFIWDFVKVTLLIMTVIIFSYNGKIILYPSEGLSDPLIYFRNLMWVFLSAAFSAIVYERLEKLLYGKFLVALVLSSNLAMWVFLDLFHYNDQWLIIAFLNGSSIAGVFAFIEQKIAKSGNIGVLPGMMFYLIYIIQVITVVLNSISDLDSLFPLFRVVFSLGGLIFVYIKINYFPDKEGIKYKITGEIKYTKIINGTNENE
ncbi:MAG: hypothetical protein ACTSU2_13110 [Promethearchaeota archaeon]